MSKTTKTPLRNHQRPLRLQEDFLETHRRLGISLAARGLKIDTELPRRILGTFIMSKTTKTPLRNLQRPLRLHGWRFNDALENQGVYGNTCNISMFITLWSVENEMWILSKLVHTPNESQCEIQVSGSFFKLRYIYICIYMYIYIYIYIYICTYN